MRTIKFRAWHPIYKRMIWGPTDGGSVSPAWVLTMCQANPDVPLMQFTGLLDKNGKEIYEGDIVKGNGREFKDKTCEVRWVDTGAHFLYFPIEDDTFGTGMYMEQWPEVIGNVWENPELLEAK